MRPIALTLCYLIILAKHTSLSKDAESLKFKEDKLVHKIKSKMPEYFPPDDIHNNEVVFSLGLKQIVEVDEKKNSWTISFEILIQYFSESAKWDPGEYGGNEYIFIKEHSVWRPETGNFDTSYLN